MLHRRAVRQPVVNIVHLEEDFQSARPLLRDYGFGDRKNSCQPAAPAATRQA